MYKYIIIFLFFFFSFQLNSQFLTHRYEFEKVKKERISMKKLKIFKINEYSSEILVNPSSDLLLTKSTEFDEDGFKIQETIFDSEYGNIINKFYYNTKGNLFKIVLANYDIMDLLSTFTYDSSGKLVQEFFAGGENRKYIIKYNNKNRITEKVGYTGSLPFDENGEVIENAEPIWHYIDRYEYEYNSKSELTVEKFYYLDNISYTNFFYYDKSGKRTKWINRFGDNYDVVYLYNYDKNGLLKHIEVKSPDETKFIIYDYEFYK